MRIGIDAHFVGVRHGGNEIHFENLINHLAQRPGNRDDFYAFTYRLAARERLRGERLTLIPLSSRLVSWQRGVEIPLQSRRLRLDVLHVPFNVVPVFRPRKVVTIHDLGFLHVPEAFTPWERARLAVLTPVAARAADHVFAVSAFTKHEIADRYRLREERITVTPSAVDRTVFRPLSVATTAATRARLGLDCDFVLFVGTLQPRKNVPALIEAYDRLRRKGRFSSLHLVLAGRKGWYFDAVFRLVRERGLEGRVHHVGAVDTETLVALYSSAAAFVLPSRYEGLGLPLLEAMSCGCPVISSNASALPEVYGEAALAFDPNDPDELAAQLERVLDDRACRDELVRRGFQNCERFSWERTAAVVETVYHSL